MSHTIRAKFSVWQVADIKMNDVALHKVSVAAQDIKLGAVYSEVDTENATFWKATPNGQLTMTIQNPDAFTFFIPGREYYLDFTLAPLRCRKCAGKKRTLKPGFTGSATDDPTNWETCERCGGDGVDPDDATKTGSV